MNYTVFQWFNNFAESSKLLDTLMIAITNSAAYVAILFMLILWFNNGKKVNAIKTIYSVIYDTFSHYRITSKCCDTCGILPSTSVCIT